MRRPSLRNKATSPEPMEASRRFLAYSVVVLCLPLLVLCSVLQLNVLSVALAVVGVLALAIADFRALLTLTYPIVSLLGAVLSVGVIEGGAYVGEQRRYGFNIGAAGWLSAYALGFIALAHIAILWGSRFVRRSASIPLRNLRIFLIVFAGLIAVFYTTVFMSFGMGLTHPTRFEWFESLPEMVRQLNNVFRSFLLPAFFGVAGFIFWCAKRPHWWMLAMLVPIAAMGLMGEKFSSFVYAISMFLTGIGIAALVRGDRLRLRVLHVAIGAGVAALLLVLILEGYRRTGSANVLNDLSYRIALQGHVWFGIADRFGGMPGVALSDAFGETTLQNPAGLDFLSYLVATKEFVEPRLAAGIPFTMGGPATILGAFGVWAGFAIYSLAGLTYALVVLAAAYFLIRGEPFGATAAFVAYVAVGLGTQMGYWDAFYGTIMLGTVAIVIASAAWMKFRPAWARRRPVSPIPSAEADSSD